MKFLSTPSARRATDLIHVEAESEDISIHALREEGDAEPEEPEEPKKEISIHALREEGDRAANRNGLQFGNFYPRPPRGGRLANLGEQAILKKISIHALREEGDSKNRDKISIFL